MKESLDIADIYSADMDRLFEDIMSACSPDMTPEECEQVRKFFLRTILAHTLMETILSGEVEIIGFKEGGPVVRVAKQLV